MKRSYWLILALFLISLPLFAQYNEKDILSQQAYQLLAQRQYNQAEALFLQILEKYPTDQNTVIQLLQIFYQTSQTQKAEALLTDKQRSLPQNVFTEQSILLLIHKALPIDAMNLARNYLSLPNTDQNKYRLIASYFEARGFFEQVLELYDNARKRFSNPDLFTMEIANSALNYRLFPRAIREYMRYLELNPGNLYFVNNQIKTIVKEDPSMVEIVAEKARSGNDQILWELYAGILVDLRQYPQALDAYKNLPWNRLYRFAEDQFAALNDEVGIIAYAWLDSTATDPGWRAEYRLRLAQIAYRNGKTGEAKRLLKGIIDDPGLSVPAIRNRIQANYLGRRLYTDILISEDAPQDSVLTMMTLARSFARNGQEMQDSDLMTGRYYLLREDYDAANRMFSRVTDATLIEKVAFFRFMEALMRDMLPKADSLMNEYVIKYPGSSYTNDAIYLMMLVYGLKGAEKGAFFDAYRSYLLQKKDAPDKLDLVFGSNGDEELRILAVEWAISLGETDKARTLLEYEWQDEVMREYSALIKLSLSADQEYEQRFAREYLKQNPNSIFSPRMRQVISRISYGRPNL